MFQREVYSNLLIPLGIKVNDWKPILYANKKKHSHLTIAFDCDFCHPTLTAQWYKNLIDFIKEEIPYIKIIFFYSSDQEKRLNYKENEWISSIDYDLQDNDMGNIIDLVNNIDLFISDNRQWVSITNALQKPVLGILQFIENKLTLPEDIFIHIKKAILEPLKIRSSMYSFDEYHPILSGKKDFYIEEKINQKVGVIILAGGMGRRLGLNKPKGLLSIGDECLYDILLKKSSRANKIGILTSPVTHKETQQYCEGKGIDIFEKKIYPTESGDGYSPEGNGALYDAIVYSSYWQEWKKTRYDFSHCSR